MNREYELNIGPNHPGIPGNFSLHLELEGDTIVKANGDSGYLHRAFEKLMEHRLYLQNLALIPRICVPEPDINEAVYAMAIEELMQVEIPERAKFIRTIILEAARVNAYLFGLGGFAASLGLYTPSQWMTGDRDYMVDLFAKLTGARIYHMFIWPGGVRRDLPEGFESEILDWVRYIKDKLPDYDAIFFKNSMFLHRSKGVATITREEALSMGITGPNLKAVGVAQDVRKDEPYAAYPYLDFDIPLMTEGDAWARTIIRRLELEMSLNLIEQAVKKMPKGPVMARMPNPFKWYVPKGDAYARVESSRGEYGFYFVSDGGAKPYRVSVRGVSMSHMYPMAEKLLIGQKLSDASQILGSLDICPPEIDR
ncbi:MAG: NADH-quinone oxidoreductase subunit D [Caldisericaceae bacterium]